MSGPIPAPTWRLFIAIEIPADIRSQIEAVQTEFRKLAAPEIIRWTPPEQFHITLNFLGDVPADRLELLKSAVAKVCASNSPFQLSATGIGFFPNVRQPRVLWVGVKDQKDELIQLHSRLQAVFRPLVDFQKSEPFSAHITLGRFKETPHHVAEKFLAHISTLSSLQIGFWQASEAAIFRSELVANGAKHTLLYSFKLPS